MLLVQAGFGALHVFMQRRVDLHRVSLGVSVAIMGRLLVRISPREADRKEAHKPRGVTVAVASRSTAATPRARSQSFLAAITDAISDGVARPIPAAASVSVL